MSKFRIPTPAIFDPPFVPAFPEPTSLLYLSKNGILDDDPPLAKDEEADELLETDRESWSE
jgi:hypothetical protein